MSNLIFKIKRNDTLPKLKLKVRAKGSLGQNISYNMSGVTGTTFTMKDDCGNIKVYAQAGQFICQTGGTLQYTWQDGDTDTAGTYYGEFELNYATGDRMSLPQTDNIKIQIIDDLNVFN